VTAFFIIVATGSVLFTHHADIKTAVMGELAHGMVTNSKRLHGFDDGEQRIELAAELVRYAPR
jgi:hypothetical protein